MWTLICNGTEKTLENWGILSDLKRTTANKVKGTVSFRTQEAFDPLGGTRFVMGQFAQIWRDRTALGTGGSIWHQGWFDDPAMSIEGGKQYVRYQLHDVFWKFERNGFCQQRQVVTGFTGGHYDQPIYSTVICTEAYLHEGPDGLRHTNGWEIGEICDWLNEMYNPTKRGAVNNRSDAQDLLVKGTIEPATFPPITRANSLLCSEVLLNVLRLTPDAVIFVDVDPVTSKPRFNVRTVGKWNYGTVPPTFIDYTNLPEVTINITADQEASIILQGQQSRRQPAVILFYLSNATVNGFTVPAVLTDVFPGGTNLWTPEAGRYTVELEGATVSTEAASIQTQPISLLTAADQPGQVAWWLAHDRSLLDTKIVQSTIKVGTPSIVDGNNNPIDLGAFPNELLTPLPKWIGANVIKATVCAEVAFDKYVDDTHLIPDVKVQRRSVRKTIKLTNAVTGTYQAIKEATSGEVPPAGVAEAVFRGLDLVQWAGSIRFVGAQARSDIKLGIRLKLVGPNTTFSNVIPQRVTEQPHFGYVEVEYGPSAPPDINSLVDISRSVRGRTTYRMPSARATGGIPDGGEDQNSEPPGDDTSHGPGGNAFGSETYQDEQ